MNTIYSIDSIVQLHKVSGYTPPKHPLVTVIDVSKINPPQPIKNARVRLGFYSISLKSNVEEGVQYGRQYYDFQDGSLVFMKPNQVAVFDITAPNEEASGWMLCFHPEFIRGTALAKKIEQYNFFSYNVNEALHLSDNEKNILTAITTSIKEEISQNIDTYTRTLILNNLELILNYSDRYYGRQFLTRVARTKDIISEFDTLLKERITTERLESEGIPSVKEFADILGYSTYYLSDMLKKETGRGTQDYIHEKLLQNAKDLLISTDLPVNQIGYQLGFEYPTHFSKFFKKKTGMSPSKYRKE